MYSNKSRALSCILTLCIILLAASPLQAGEIALPGSGAFGATVTPDGKTLYVTQFGTYSPWVVGTDAVVIDTASDSITGTVACDARPQDVAFTKDGKYALITNSSGGTVTVVEVATATPISTVSVGTPFATFVFGIAITPDGSRAYVCTTGGNYDGSEENIIVLDANPNSDKFTEVIGTIEISGGFSRPAFRRNGKELVVPRGFADNNFSATPQVVTFDTKRNSLKSITEVVPVPGGVHGIEDLAVTANGRFAYAPAFNWVGGSDEVYVIDLQKQKVSDIISLGSGDVAQHGVGISPDGLLVAVTNYFKGSVSFIFTPTHTVVMEIAVGANPNEVAFTPDGRKVYVTNQGSGTVSVIQLQSSVELLISLVETAIDLGHADAKAARDLTLRIGKLRSAKNAHQVEAHLRQLIHRVQKHATKGRLEIGQARLLFPPSAPGNDVPTPLDPGGVFTGGRLTTAP